MHQGGRCNSLSNCTLHASNGGIHVQSAAAAEKGRRRTRMKSFLGKSKPHKHPPPSSKKRRCGALCCSSRLSVSSASSDGVRSSDQAAPEQLESLSSLAHGMVQARLDHMVSQWQINPGAALRGSQRRRRGGGGWINSGCIFLIAVDRSSRDPKGDFKASILEIIASERIEEPKELRGLLNCYLSVNSSEHRRAILEAFHEGVGILTKVGYHARRGEEGGIDDERDASGLGGANDSDLTGGGVIAVDDGAPTEGDHGDGHGGLGHGVHGRGDAWDGEGETAGESRGEVDDVGWKVDVAGEDDDIVVRVGDALGEKLRRREAVLHLVVGLGSRSRGLEGSLGEVFESV
ncbi:hypothetical protein Cni_G17608 [Canna indica]|uniref:Transcription repressor n=1 Tax=Canna indica TaxID=4628 RepID=A0AAQ3KJI4_9LILI|nr:hypothetical protein Cni_G17608 [Canna indica]